MKGILVVCLLLFSMTVGAQKPAEIANCPPEFYNKVDSLISTILTQGMEEKVTVDSMRIDSLKHSILGDKRFTDLLDEASKDLFGSPNDIIEWKFFNNVDTGRDEEILADIKKRYKYNCCTCSVV